MTVPTLTPWSDDRAQPQARVLVDSISETGARLTTLEVTFHRFVLAEFNTHRLFSRNSASSRAIPVSRQIAKVREHPAIPVSFPAEQSGMQGGEELTGHQAGNAEFSWITAAKMATTQAQAMHELGVHKSVTNRLLEPFMWHTVIVSATDWGGFWAQRCSPLAQSEIRVAAEQMKLAYDASTPTLLKQGEWHLPLIFDEDWGQVAQSGLVALGASMYPVMKKISTARCARVSYLTHDGTRDIEKDLALYTDTLAKHGHWSPLEHVATPCPQPASLSYAGDEHEHRGNFTGWDQFRHEVSDS